MSRPKNAARWPLTTTEFAERIGVHPRTVRNWITAGLIVPQWTGGRQLIDPAELDRADLKEMATRGPGRPPKNS